MVYGRKYGGNGEVGAAGAAVSHGGVAGAWGVNLRAQKLTLVTSMDSSDAREACSRDVGGQCRGAGGHSVPIVGDTSVQWDVC